jgi:hypothetical protein
MTRAAFLAVGLLASLLLTGAAGAQRDPDVDAAGRVILEQLDAFRRDDFDTAFTLASATIHDQFDRPRFEAMVRGGYPEIARSVSALIEGGQRGDSGELFLFLTIRGVNGLAVQAVYEMINENGRWRVNGVVTRPDPSEKA